MPSTKAHLTCGALRSAAALLLLALVSAAIWVPAAIADSAAYAGASSDGENVFFTTDETLVPGDTDNKRDVYERFYEDAVGIENYVTREVSTGPAGGNDAHEVSFDGISSDGFRVFFSTPESLVSQDKDLSTDVYMRNLHTGDTIWVSRGDPSCVAANCGNAAIDVSFDAVSSAGTEVVFSTEEALSGEDEDSVEDVYLRDIGAGTTILLSAAAPSCSVPNCGNGAAPAFFHAASADALTVVFGSGEQLSGEDGDLVEEDIYTRDVLAETTELVSQAGVCPAGLGLGECTPIFGGISGDGSHVFYETGEQVAAGLDDDQGQDVYGWSGAAPVLISTGPEGGGDENSTYAGTAPDGSAAFFETSEALTDEDKDSTAAVDAYKRSGGTTELVSTGPTDAGAGVPANFEKTDLGGSMVVFRTAEPLTVQDEDFSHDIYLRDTGTDSTVLLSLAGAGCAGTCGKGAVDASFAGASSDNADVFFETMESLVAGDSDSSLDIYRRSDGQTMLVSTGPTSKNGASNPHLEDVSEDASHALLTTEEKLTSGDFDTEPDVYDRAAGETLLVSTRNPDDLVLGPPVPALTATNPASPGVSTEPRILGEADPGTSIKLYATADCSGAPVATGSSTELEGAGIAVKIGLSSTTSFRVTATLLNDTSACSATGLTYQQVAETGGGGGGGAAGGAGSGGGTPAGSQPGAGGAQGGASGQPLEPLTRITFAPASKTRQRRPTFRFVDSTGQQDTRFICSVDRGRWSSCSSPIKLKKLGRGRHVFKVKGVNSGLLEPTPATRSFKVVTR